MIRVIQVLRIGAPVAVLAALAALVLVMVTRFQGSPSQAPVVAASVAVAGWFVTQWLKDFSEGKTRELAIIERQLAELYGPIFGLLVTSQKAFKAARELYGFPGSCVSFFDNQAHFDNGKCKVESLKDWIRLCRMDSIAAFEILEILQHKLYLLQGSEVPESFSAYGAHWVEFREIFRRWDNEEASGANLPADLSPTSCKAHYDVPYPIEFYDDIAVSFLRLKERQAYLRGLIGQSFRAPSASEVVWERSLHSHIG